MTKTPKELALLAAKALSDKKGREIQVLETIKAGETIYAKETKGGRMA